MSSISSWALSVGQSVLFVDPENGTDTSNTTCGESLATPSTGPCQSLNVALANAANGASIFITRPGVFGPIILTGPINISGPPDGEAMIQWSSTVPGCIGGSNCNGGSAATYAVDIQAGATNTVKLKNVIINANGASAAALHVGTAFGVALTKVPLRCGPGTSAPEAMLVDSSQGSQIQLYFHESDIGFCSGGGAIVVEPTGTTPVRINFNNSEVHNATFGLQAVSTGLSGNANIQVLVDSSQFFSFNNSAISVLSSASANGAAVSLTRSAIVNTGGAAIKANGMGAGGILYETAIIGNAAGVNVVNGAGVFTYQNNEIIFNGNNCEVNGAAAACSTALTPQAPF